MKQLRTLSILILLLALALTGCVDIETGQPKNPAWLFQNSTNQNLQK